MSRNASLAAAFALAAAVIASPAVAEVQMFKGDLSGAAASPPTDSKGVGSIAVTLDPKTRKISWKGYFVGLEGQETKAHFHGPAKPGETASPTLPAEAVEEVFQGQATLDAKQVKQLEGGQWFFSVHSSKHPEGELRGQLNRVR